METDWAGGKSVPNLGPGNLYTKPISEGSWSDPLGWTPLGPSESVIWRIITTKVDLVESQGGDRAVDKVVSSQQVQFEINMSRPFVERLESNMQGFVAIRDTAGAITRVGIANVLGQRDSSNYVWVKFIPFSSSGGAESTDPLDIIYIKGAPSTDQVEMTYDATTQRFLGIMFEAYLNDDPIEGVQDELGRYLYTWSDEVI